MKRPESVEHPDFDTLWDYGKPAETAEKFRGRLEAARDGGDADYLAQLLSQLARTEGLQQRFEAAVMNITPTVKMTINLNMVVKTIYDGSAALQQQMQPAVLRFCISEIFEGWGYSIEGSSVIIEVDMAGNLAAANDPFAGGGGGGEGGAGSSQDNFSGALDENQSE